MDLRERAEEHVLTLDPDEVEGFFSYRVAEAVLMLGGLDALGPEPGGAPSQPGSVLA